MVISEKILPIDPKKLLPLLIVVVIICLLFCKCSTEKQDQKAVNRVNANAILQNEVANQYLQVHPCLPVQIKPDSVFFYSIDTLHMASEPIKIPIIKYKNIDTIIGNISVFMDSTGLVVKYLGSEIKETTKYIRTEVDQNLVNSLRDSLQLVKQNYAKETGKYEESQEQVVNQSKKLAEKDLIIIALCIALALSVYLNIKPSVNSLLSKFKL